MPVQTVVSLSRLAEFRLGWSTVDEWLGRLHCKKGYKFSHSQPGCLQTIPDREQLTLIRMTKDEKRLAFFKGLLL